MPLVSVLTTEMMRFVPQQASVAVGGSKFHCEPQVTVLFVAQVTTGGVRSATVTTWVQITLLLHVSVICHLRVTTKGQAWLLVTVLSTVTFTLVLVQRPAEVGVSKFHANPHSTVLLVGQGSCATQIVPSTLNLVVFHRRVGPSVGRLMLVKPPR